MIFPKGKVRHKDLLTSYTDIPALLSTLKSERFSGTIEIEFPEIEGILFIDTGEVINAEVRVGADPKRMIGSEAIQYILTLSHQKDGALDIYQLLPEQVAILADSLDHEIIFKELSTDFTRFDRLLLKLREEKHDGFIEVFTKDHQPTGVLFLQEGEPIEMFTTSPSSPSIFGKKSIPTFVENTVKGGAFFNVYRSSSKMEKKEALKVPEAVHLSEEEREIVKTEKVKDVAKEEMKKVPVEEKKFPSEENKILLKEKEFEDKEIPMGKKKISQEETSKFRPEKETSEVPLKDEVSKIPKGEIPLVEEKDERKALLLILQEVLSKTERLVDGVSQKGKFLSLFKKSLLEKSSKYFFLDPFSAEFNYQDGTLFFNGNAESSELAEGVVDCLKATLFKIEKELSKNKPLSSMLRLEIESVLKRHRETVKRMGLETAFSPFYQ